MGVALGSDRVMASSSVRFTVEGKEEVEDSKAGSSSRGRSHQMAAATREGASTMEGTKMTTEDANTSRTESPGPAKMVGAKKKKYRSRSASASSQDSFSSGSYTGSSSDEDEASPREDTSQTNSQGSSDFCVRKISA